MNMRTTTRAGTGSRAGALLLLLAGAGGCAPHYTDYDAFISDPPPLVTATDYRVAPPDTILISSRRVKEINGHSETVRPDGKITLPLLGTYFVAGKTPEQASAELEEAAREYYQDADVSLRVVGFNSKKIYVWGEVAAPGVYPYTGTNTIFRTLTMAQPTRLADRAKVEVLRPSRDGTLVRRMTIDLDRMVKAGDTAQDAVLEENDVIWVPPNPLAAVALTLQQVLLPIQPAVQTLQGPADIGAAATGVRPYGARSGTE